MDLFSKSLPNAAIVRRLYHANTGNRGSPRSRVAAFYLIRKRAHKTWRMKAIANTIAHQTEKKESDLARGAGFSRMPIVRVARLA